MEALKRKKKDKAEVDIELDDSNEVEVLVTSSNFMEIINRA